MTRRAMIDPTRDLAAARRMAEVVLAEHRIAEYDDIGRPMCEHRWRNRQTRLVANCEVAILIAAGVRLDPAPDAKRCVDCGHLWYDHMARGCEVHIGDGPDEHHPVICPCTEPAPDALPSHGPCIPVELAGALRKFVTPEGAMATDPDGDCYFCEAEGVDYEAALNGDDPDGGEHEDWCLVPIARAALARLVPSEEARS